MSAYRDAVVALAPVAYWRLGEPSGTVALDEMWLHHGEYLPGPTLGATSLLTGDTNTALTGSGLLAFSGALVTAPMPALNQWSIAFWLKGGTNQQDDAFSGIVVPAGEDIRIVRQDNGDLYLNDPLGPLWTGETIAVGESAFYVFSFNGDTLPIYRDGVLILNEGRGGAIGAVPWWITAFPPDEGINAIGDTIDELAVWDRWLTPEEVLYLYQIGTDTWVDPATSLTLRAYTGAGAATESSSQAGVVLTDVDALTGGAVAQGTLSFERWLRLRVDVAPAAGVTNFWVQNDGALPAGVSLKFGVTDTPTTPVATASAVATMDLTSGRRFIFDTNVYDTVGDHTRYIVIQEVVAIGAPSGAIDTQALTFGYQES